MSNRPFHKRYHSDALAGMMSLTLEERGAYQTLLDLIYDRGGPIVDNERLIAGYLNCSLRKWRALRSDLIEKGKIAITSEGAITNFRAEKELENGLKTSRKLAENGSKGGRKKAEVAKKANENNDSDQQGTEISFSLYQKPETRSQNKRENKSLSRCGIPDWIPDDEWRGFIAMRAKIKKPLTDRAITMAVGKLSELRDAGEDPASVLEQSTYHCWQDLYEVKNEQKAQPAVPL